MPGELTSAELDAFRSAIAVRLGLSFDDGKMAMLAEIMRRRLEACRTTPTAYLRDLSAEGPREEIRALARELTVTETYFFRHMDQFRAFSEVAVPERLQTRGGGGPLVVLSAGCASGEEPYSLAILLCQELSEALLRTVAIRAVDINPVMLERARRAWYSSWSLRETPEEIRKHWFRERGRDFVLDERARTMVTFEERNLAEDDPRFFQAGAYDIVFCRNLLMYLAPDVAGALVSRLARSLVPGGLLFLGHAETLRGLSNDFHLRHSHESFYYERREQVAEREATRVSTRPEPVAHAGGPLVAMTDTSGSWVETIRRASERIQSLTGTGAPRRTLPPRVAGSLALRGRSDLGRAVDLFRQERYAEALIHVRALAPESSTDSEALLLRAVLLAHSGDLREAERVCEDLLAQDEMSAGAHYLLAICREGIGDRQGALDHDQVAVYLDPAFAMPRLHLGLIARRLGEKERARRELGQALVLLQREDASRVLLFGGGFSREALVALCRAELVASGGAP